MSLAGWSRARRKPRVGGTALVLAKSFERRRLDDAPDPGSRSSGVKHDDDERPVLITGICGRLGRRLARVLHRQRRVVGIDRRAFLGVPKDIRHYQIDIRSKKTKDVFRIEQPVAVVHLGVMHDPRKSGGEHHSWNVAGFQRLLGYIEQYKVPKLVVLSSANAYGPRPDNAQFISENAPLLGAAAFSDIRDLVEVDILAQSFLWRRPETETVILRPVHILGAVGNAPSNYLRQSVVPTLLGYDPMVQVIHTDDVIGAVIQALSGSARGVFNLAGPPPAPVSRLIALAGRTRVPVPQFLFKRALERMWSFRATSFPPPELEFIKYVCMVDDARARGELGYRAAFDLRATVAAIDELC
ncbi:MAG: NAD-dependent epimerase/dehydratase family protein [Myxococcales bacterium]|nr:NAD-dependent epimerase/dehydratase family protein [Myxococcales bacterium]